MFKAVESPYLVPFDGRFKLARCPTRPPKGAADRDDLVRQLQASVEDLSELQRRLYAHDRYAVLLVFQAMDAAGKDSTIRAVLSGVDPAGCEVYSFKRPSDTDLDHDFLWRTSLCLPQRGRIGVFNRSYYEEVLVVRVHPEFLHKQKLPDAQPLKQLWKQRYESICDHEKHLARNGTVILKFWLNVSKEEQRQRLIARLDEPEKHWKFEAGDLHERELWPDYMKAYDRALRATSAEHAPWYAIPADNKAYMRATVADIVVRTLKSLDLGYPVLDEPQRAGFEQIRAQLIHERTPKARTGRF
ncbi:MAG: PPK2 family polyphosphate kinase [Panacagrimonas sp.]